MEREIALFSYSVKNTGNNQPENFVTKFTRPIILDSNHEHAIGLNRVINMSFTWFNINPGYSNQLIKYSKDNRNTWTDITFLAGAWNYKHINNHIQELTVITRAGKDDEYPITLEFDVVTFRVTITLKENYQLDLTHSNFYDVIGFDKKISTDEINIGPRVPNLAQDTEILNVHCDVVNYFLVDGEESDVIYSFLAHG